MKLKVKHFIHNFQVNMMLKDLNQKVDIFGIPYTGITQNVEYIYGGITLSNDYLDNARNIPINLWINGQHKTISTDRVSTNKNK